MLFTILRSLKNRGIFSLSTQKLKWFGLGFLDGFSFYLTLQLLITEKVIKTQ